MATYLASLEPECFDYYAVRKQPAIPQGYSQDYFRYSNIDVSSATKKEAWKGITEKHKGYLRKKEEVDSQNLSDMNYLNDMMLFFRKNLMASYEHKCKLRLQDFILEGYKLPPPREEYDRSREFLVKGQS